jgi:hypothetical protein
MQAIMDLHPEGPEAAAAEEQAEAAELKRTSAAAAAPARGPSRLGKAASMAVRVLPPGATAACASGDAGGAGGVLQQGVSTPRTPASGLRSLPSLPGAGQASGSFPETPTGGAELDDFQVGAHALTPFFSPLSWSPLLS